MLCAIRKSDSTKVIACREEKRCAPFSCPECHQDLVLKKGTKVTHHFAHKPPVTCLYGSGESEAHRQAKMEIFETLQKSPLARKIELERSLGTVRPDVSGLINNVRVAIEVQISSLSLETIHHRTVEYARKGIYLLWVSPWHKGLDEERYAPRLWEKWIHGLYFGHVYYWRSATTVAGYRFKEFTITVEA
jgi:competence protein CoiA